MTRAAIRIWVGALKRASLSKTEGSRAARNDQAAHKCARTCEAKSARCEKMSSETTKVPSDNGNLIYLAGSMKQELLANGLFCFY